ncbi:MAG: hypothetical protein K6W08_07360 [Firmicutes bacterium]|nr:hypothetical protein [Bacillota bacterium]
MSDIEILTRPPEVRFGVREVGPPAALYISREDALILRMRTGLAGPTVIVSGRLLTPDGEIRPFLHEVRLSGAGTLESTTLQAAEGYLMSLVVRTTAATVRAGDIYAEAVLARPQAGGAVILALLVQGYVTSTDILAWPTPRFRGAQEGAGGIVVNTVAAPGAGLDWSFTVAADVRARVVSLAWQFTTDATVATRAVRLIVDDGTNFYLLSAPSETQTASQTRFYSAHAGGFGVTGVDYVRLALPPDLVLREGHRIRTSTQNIQPGDAHSLITIVTEQWIEP